VITDFQNRRDRIKLKGRLQFDDLIIRQSGSDTVVRTDDDVLVILLDTRSNLITGADFI
jgi:hypothetical protein